MLVASEAHAMKEDNSIYRDKPPIIWWLLIKCKNLNSLQFSFADKPNLPDLPRRRVDLLQREPAGIIQPAASINFKTKQKPPLFLLLVCCFKTNFCQNRHIASLVFLPHTGECYSVSRAFPIHLSIWQIPSVCKIDGKTFLNSTFFCKFFNFSWLFGGGKISFLHQIQIS